MSENPQNQKALAYWTNPNNFPVYTPPRTRIDKLINPQTRMERKRAKRFRGLVGAVVLMSMMPKPEFGE